MVNLYPFEATVKSSRAFEDTIENIDIGGPAMIRGAAKNHDDVAVIVDPADYADLLGEIDRTTAARATLSAAASRRALRPHRGLRCGDLQLARRPVRRGDAEMARLRRRLRESSALRYGENPHQGAAVYLPAERGRRRDRAEVQGKELSYNNINDTDAAFELVAEFIRPKPAIAIIKHANPCGVATGATCSRPIGRRSPATRSAPSAASSR